MTPNEKFRKIFFYKHYYLIFFNAQTEEVKTKFNWTLNLITTLENIPGKYFQYIESSEGLFEIRVQVGNNIFRAFAFFDEGKLIVIANAFQKITQKTPYQELKLAQKIKNEYFYEK